MHDGERGHMVEGPGAQLDAEVQIDTFGFRGILVGCSVTAVGTVVEVLDCRMGYIRL